MFLRFGMVPEPRIDDNDVLSDSNDEAYDCQKKQESNTTAFVRKLAPRLIPPPPGGNAMPPNGNAIPWVPTTGTDDGFQKDNGYRRRVPPKAANNGTTTKWTNN